MVIFVSSRIPPDHTGSGKRIFHYFEYLVNSQKEDAYIITWSNHVGNDRVSNPAKSNTKLLFPLNILRILMTYFKIVRARKKKDRVNVWLVSYTYLTLVTALAAKATGARVIMQSTLDGDDDPFSKPPNDLMNLNYYLKKLQYKLSDSITCVSKALYDKTKGHYRNVSYIPNPVDLEKFNFKENGKNKNKKTILFVGALTERKGIDIVFKTASKILNERDDVEFCLVGPYDHSIFEKYSEILPHGRIRLEGYQTDVISFYRKADILFLPSRREGMPTVFLEAMASRLPVICKKLKDVTDEIFPEQYDLMIEGENPDSYYHAIRQLLDDSGRIERIAQLNYEAVKKFEKVFIYNLYFEMTQRL